MIYDDNEISIEGDTDIAFSEDVSARYRAYGWHVQDVDWTNGGSEYVEDVQALWEALEKARRVTDQPSFINLRTIIAWPAPNAQGTGKSHGSALGEDEVAATKRILGFDPERTFEVSDEVIDAHPRRPRPRQAGREAEWQECIRRVGCQRYRQRHELLERMRTRTLPDGWADALPSFPADAKGVATRKASGEVLSAIAPVLPELWGGSADLAGSNNTTPKGEPSFVPRGALHHGVLRQQVRPGAALRHPRARHGLDHERHRPARRHPRVRRHLPRLLRLHAPGGAAGRADAACR